MAHIPFWRYHQPLWLCHLSLMCQWMVESFVERVPSKKNQLPDCGVRIFWGQVLQQILEKLSKKGRQGFIAKIWKWETFHSSNWDMGEILLMVQKSGVHHLECTKLVFFLEFVPYQLVQDFWSINSSNSFKDECERWWYECHDSSGL